MSSTDSTFACFICGKRFKDMEATERHEKKHDAAVRCEEALHFFRQIFENGDVRVIHCTRDEAGNPVMQATGESLTPIEVNHWCIISADTCQGGPLPSFDEGNRHSS